MVASLPALPSCPRNFTPERQTPAVVLAPTYFGGERAQNPPRHSSLASQQSVDAVHLSSSFAQLPTGGAPHVAAAPSPTHVPPQQSRPEAHDEPFALQGLSVGKARMLPELPWPT